MNELNETLEVVDQNNNVIGKASRKECYEKGLLHRAVNIFIFNSKGQVFLHKRSEKKFRYKLFWDLSCSEHVRVGESFMDAAKRGLREELGFDTELEEVIPIHHVDNIDESDEYQDNELVITYKGVYDGEMKYDPAEVAEGKFFDIEEVNKLIEKGELKVTPWFLEDWKILNQKR